MVIIEQRTTQGNYNPNNIIVIIMIVITIIYVLIVNIIN